MISLICGLQRNKTREQPQPSESRHLDFVYRTEITNRKEGRGPMDGGGRILIRGW